jgi:hypothetical protein
MRFLRTFARTLVLAAVVMQPAAGFAQTTLSTPMRIAELGFTDGSGLPLYARGYCAGADPIGVYCVEGMGHR